MKWKPVYQFVKTIPRGKVATYGQVARLLNLSGGARTAGRAMAACPAGQAIPWHRVVGAEGRLLLRESRVGLQRKLLESEGLRVSEKRILDFPNHQWRPKTGRSAQPKKRKITKNLNCIRSKAIDCVIDKDSWKAQQS